MLELVLVMVIICTVLAMAAPSLRGFFGSRRTADAAAQMVALTRYARSQAAAEGRTYRLNVDAGEGRYWLTAQSGGAFVTLSTEFGRDFVLPKGTDAEWLPADGADAPEWIEFTPDGRATPASIRLRGQHSEVIDVTCASPAEPFEVAVAEDGM